MREEGYYWVKVKGHKQFTVAYWFDGKWWLPMSSVPWTNSYFEEIDEKRLTHE